MKQFATAAAEIVRRVVETVDDDEDFGLEDVYDVEPAHEWQQIDGDWGNPWEYGGAWYHPFHNEIIHFGGTEEEEQLGRGEIDPDDIEIPPQVLAKLPPEQEDWRENHERDRLIQQYQFARATFLNLRKRHPFTSIIVPKRTDPIFKQYDEIVAGTLGLKPGTKEFDDYMKSPPEYRILQIGQYIGFHEIGNPLWMTQRDARKMFDDPNL